MTDDGAEPADPAGDGGLVRLRLDLAYDGTDFAGWARQPGQRTVQGALEDALGTVLRLERAPVTTVAGRTDAGVHARGQVCHVDVAMSGWAAVSGGTSRAPGDALRRRLAGVLPADVAVRCVAVAAPGFDARFSARSRRYAYRIANDAAAVDPLRRREILTYGRPLDVAAMHGAGQELLGEHDFAAFCRRREGATTVRRLLRLDVGRDERGLVVADVEADAFCRSMVRALVGALCAVGEGRRGTGWPAQVLAGGVRDPRAAMAPARGLTLEEVRYPPDAELAARVAESRRVRSL